jgi:integrase/recombinase XerD
MRLTIALDGYWLARRRSMSHHTVLDYSLTFRRLVDYLRDCEVEAIAAAQIHGFLNHVQTAHQLSPKTMSNAWVALSSFFTWAEMELRLPHPMRGVVKRPQFRRRQIEAYSQPEVTALLAHIEYANGWLTRTGRRAHAKRPTGLRDRAILIVLLDTGIRASELCALTLGDYDAAEGKLTIRRGKGGKLRVVFLGQAAKHAVWRYLASRPGAKPAAPFFCARTGKFLDRAALHNMILMCAKRAGVGHATVHKFRHTFAVNFLRNGGNVLVLQRLLGHERMETLRIYVDLAQGDLAAVQAIASPADNWGL